MEHADVAILNELAALETGGLLRRVRGAHPFVGWADAEHVPILQCVLDEQAEHPRLLIDAIDQLGGVPRPATPDGRSARLQYLDLNYLLPVLAEDQERRVEAYRRAAAQVTSGAPASVITAILRRHENHLEQLQSLANTRSGPASAVSDTDAAALPAAP